MADWLADLETTCSALGTWDGTEYIKDDDCLECVKDLIRFLRRDDDAHEIRRCLGEIQVVQSDLVPLMRHHSGDEDLFDMVLRLLVNLTNPELLLFREELPEDKVMRHYYLEMQSHRQRYKESFVDESLWKVLSAKLSTLLKLDPSERSEDQQLIMERLLILVRNVLQIPRDSSSDTRTDDDVNVHDQILWMLHKSGMEDLLLYVASAETEVQFCLHVLEIISLMFKEQDPALLACANLSRSRTEKKEDEKALLEARLRELELRKKKKGWRTGGWTPNSGGGRHSRFGGTFVVTNVSSISDNRNLIVHRPLRDLNSVLDFDRDKRPKKVTPQEETSTRRSTLSIRLFLKEFCIEFLGGAYNSLMRSVKDFLVRQRAQQNDESYYLWAVRFFLEFNRRYQFRPELVSETVNKSVFHYVQQQVETYKDNFLHEKKNRPACLLWGRRIHLALRAYHELLSTLVAMENSSDADIKQSAKVIRASVFFEPEYRELTLALFHLYTPEKMSPGFLRDLVEANHVFLKIMEHMAKSKHLVVGKRVKKNEKRRGKEKGTKGSTSSAVPSSEMTPRESKETLWDLVSSRVSSLLQDDEADLPRLAPFDAASEVEIDEQKVGAVYKIQKHLEKREAEQALALLRAARDVWPEGEVFGAEDAEPEDEFMALREILFAEVKRPGWMAAREPADEGAGTAEEGGGTDGGGDSGEAAAESGVGENDGGVNEEEEVEEEEEEYATVETYVTEQHFDFVDFVLRFAIKNVCVAYAQLFGTFRGNSDFTNHCVVKMFHRIAYDCKKPALLFQVSIFRTFQKIDSDYKLLSREGAASKSLAELRTFAKYLLRQFFDCAEKNKKVFMELCFWKKAEEAWEIVNGYECETKTAKKSTWSEEDEEKLERVFRQFQEMREKDGDTSDMLDAIEAFFEGSGKTRRQIAKKLKAMNLIKDSKELKAITSRREGGGGRRRRRRRGGGEGNGDHQGDDGGGSEENREFLSRSFVSTDDSSSDEEVVGDGRKGTNRSVLEELEKEEEERRNSGGTPRPSSSASDAAVEVEDEEVAMRKRKEELKRKQQERWARAFGSDDDDDSSSEEEEEEKKKKGKQEKASRKKRKRVVVSSDDEEEDDGDKEATQEDKEGAGLPPQTPDAPASRSRSPSPPSRSSDPPSSPALSSLPPSSSFLSTPSATASRTPRSARRPSPVSSSLVSSPISSRPSSRLTATPRNSTKRNLSLASSPDVGSSQSGKRRRLHPDSSEEDDGDAAKKSLPPDSDADQDEEDDSPVKVGARRKKMAAVLSDDSE